MIRDDLEAMDFEEFKEAMDQDEDFITAFELLMWAVCLSNDMDMITRKKIQIALYQSLKQQQKNNQPKVEQSNRGGHGRF